MIHSLIIVYVTKIAFIYFKEDTGQRAKHWLDTSRDQCAKAQLMVFVMLGNTEERGYYATMYNDEIMILYLILCVYYVLVNRPFLATFFFTLGLSVKAGLILLLPAFLG